MSSNIDPGLMMPLRSLAHSNRIAHRPVRAWVARRLIPRLVRWCLHS